MIDRHRNMNSVFYAGGKMFPVICRVPTMTVPAQLYGRREQILGFHIERPNRRG